MHSLIIDSLLVAFFRVTSSGLIQVSLFRHPGFCETLNMLIVSIIKLYCWTISNYRSLITFCPCLINQDQRAVSAVSSRHHRPGDPERHASPGASAESHGHQQAALIGQSDDDVTAGCLISGIDE